MRLLLQKGYRVRSLVRSQSRLDNLQGLDVELVKGDLNDPQLWEAMQGCQYLFHVAAHYSLWQADRELLYRHNVSGTRNVLAAARQAGIDRTVYTSSVAAIGTKKTGETVDETYQSPCRSARWALQKIQVLGRASRSGSRAVWTRYCDCQPDQSDRRVGY